MSGGSCAKKMVSSSGIREVAVGDKFGFAEHISAGLDRAGVRRGDVATLVRISAGLAMGILRTALAALLTSPSRHTPVAVGSGTHQGHVQHLETQHANIFARRITGISHSARPAALHVCEDVTSARKLFIEWRTAYYR